MIQIHKVSYYKGDMQDTIQLKCFKLAYSLHLFFFLWTLQTGKVTIPFEKHSVSPSHINTFFHKKQKYFTIHRL